MCKYVWIQTIIMRFSFTNKTIPTICCVAVSFSNQTKAIMLRVYNAAAAARIRLKRKSGNIQVECNIFIIWISETIFFDN